MHAEYRDGRERDRQRAIADGQAFLAIADPRSPADRDAMLRTLDRLVSGGNEFLISSRAPIDGPGATLKQRVAWRERQVEFGGSRWSVHILSLGV